MYKIELHSHTWPSSCDSKLTVRELLQGVSEKGYSGLVISNHFSRALLTKRRVEDNVMCDVNCSDCKYAKDTSNIEEEEYSVLMNKWLEDVREAKRLSGEYGVRVFAGMEYGVQSCILTHIGILGLTEDDMLNLRIQPDRTIEYLNDLRKLNPNIMLVHNHPARNGIRIYKSGEVEAFERFNTKSWQWYNIDNKLGCPEYGLTVCGSDIHDASNIGSSYMNFYEMPRDEHDLVRLIRQRKYRICIEVDG